MHISVYGPNDDPGTVYLWNWSIRALPNRDWLLCGTSGHEGHVSTPIDDFTPATRTGITTDGRKYVLVGRCGLDKGAENVWAQAMAARQISEWRDITFTFVPDARTPQKLPSRSFSRRRPFTKPAMTLEHFNPQFAELDKRDKQKGNPTT